MSFGSEIYTKLKDDSGIIAAVSTNVFGHILPDNFDITEDGLVFTYKMEEGINTIAEENVLEIYTLYVVVISMNTVTVESIADAVRSCLDNYSDDTFRDIVYQGDQNSPDPETERFTKTLQYRIIFDNN